MDVIKFRGKHVVTGAWQYGYLLGRNIIGELAYEGKEPQIQWYCQVDPTTIGQFIGRNASGQDMYDGDLFRIKDKEDPDYFNQFVFGCYWDGRGWNARIVQGREGGYDGDYTQYWLPSEDEDDATRVIVGNIHDNPELLKKAKQ